MPPARRQRIRSSKNCVWSSYPFASSNNRMLAPFGCAFTRELQQSARLRVRQTFFQSRLVVQERSACRKRQRLACKIERHYQISLLMIIELCQFFQSAETVLIAASGKLGEHLQSCM